MTIVKVPALPTIRNLDHAQNLLHEKGMEIGAQAFKHLIDQRIDFKKVKKDFQVRVIPFTELGVKDSRDIRKAPEGLSAMNIEQAILFRMAYSSHEKGVRIFCCLEDERMGVDDTMKNLTYRETKEVNIRDHIMRHQQCLLALEFYGAKPALYKKDGFEYIEDEDLSSLFVGFIVK